MILKLIKLLFGSFSFFKSQSKKFKKFSPEAQRTMLEKYNEEN